MEDNKLNGNLNRTMPSAVRHQCEWILKDLDRLKGLATNASLVNETADAVVFYADDCEGLTPESVALEALAKMDAIAGALAAIPEKYREPILEYYSHDKMLPDTASPNTWKRWKTVFMSVLARRLKLY